jgi:hypothetical protein
MYPDIASFNMLALPRESAIVVLRCMEVADAGYYPVRKIQDRTRSSPICTR